VKNDGERKNHEDQPKNKTNQTKKIRELFSQLIFPFSFFF